MVVLQSYLDMREMCIEKQREGNFESKTHKVTSLKTFENL